MVSVPIRGLFNLTGPRGTTYIRPIGGTVSVPIRGLFNLTNETDLRSYFQCWFPSPSGDYLI